jgi:hypothetical protein
MMPSARRHVDRGGRAQEEGTLDVAKVGNEVVPLDLDAVPAGAQEGDADDGGNRLGSQGRQRGTHHAVARHGTPAEDQQRIEHEVQQDGARHDEDRQVGAPDRAHDGVEDEEREIEDQAQE